VDIGRPGRPDLGLPAGQASGGEATGAAAIGAIAGVGELARGSWEQGSWEQLFLLRTAIPTAAITTIITTATIPRMALATIRIIGAPSTGVTRRTNRFDSPGLAPWPGPYRLMGLPGEFLIWFTPDRGESPLAFTAAFQEFRRVIPILLPSRR
jgi:hypothetical protein